MSKVKVDESYLKNKAKTLMEFSEFIAYTAKIITDVNADIFERYMAFHRINGIMSAANNALKITKDSITAGHNLNHIMLQTERAKECDWDVHKLEEDDFFITDDQIKNRDGFSSILGEIKDAIIDSIKEKHDSTVKH